ncbi:MAG: DUF460 domain-containing protein [Candidatus Nezhaarchaeales archaeon]
MVLHEAINKQRIIMGLDLMPSQRHMQEYALVIIDDKGAIIDRREGVDWETVSRLIKRYHVDTLAVDNLYELGGSINEVKRRLGKHIDKIRLVEVTKCDEERYVKLAELAFREGIINERKSHLSPLQAAEASALLALKGVGTTIIEPSSIRTVIIVSRGRSLGSGGMSQGRYSRSQRSAIRQITNMLLDELKKHKSDDEIEYYVQKSKYGLERSILLLNSPPSQVKRWIKPLNEIIKKSGVNIKLLTRIPSLEESQASGTSHSDKPLIVGLDPGIVTGLAVLDLNGDPLFVSSGLALDKMTITKILTKFGKPIIIASDVRRAPAIIEKMASLLGCEIYTPPRDMTIEEKRRIIQDHISNFKDIIKNAHQRDALAAALKAYLNFKSKFMQLEAKAKELNLSYPQIEKAKALLIKGLTIKEALDKVLPKDKNAAHPATIHHVDPEVQRLKQELSKLRDKVEEQNKIIRDLEESRLTLLKMLKEKEAKVEELEEALMKAPLKAQSFQEKEESLLKQKLEHSMKIISELKAKVEDLEQLIEQLKNLIRDVIKGDIVIIKEIRSITKRSIEEAMRYEALQKGDIILVRDPSSSNIEGLHYLLSIEPKAIITSSTKMPANISTMLKEKCIPIIDSEEVKIERVLDFLYTSSIIEHLIKERREKLLSERDQKIKEKFIEILRSYREERVKQLEKMYQ